MASGDDQYHPKDAIKAAVNASMVTGAAGAFVSAIQNTLTKRNVGAWGIFTRTGSTIAVFSMSSWVEMLLQVDTNGLIAVMGGAYEFTRNASANLREKDDSLNPALGGLLAGAVMGLKREILSSCV
jgi:hypothetical protein